MNKGISLGEVQQVFGVLNVSEDELKYLASKFERIELKKGDHLLRAGSRVEHTYYLYEGCMRTYFIDDQGKEHTFQFAVDDWWTSDYNALLKKEPAMMNIEALKDTTLFSLSMHDLEETCDKIRPVERFHRMKLQRAFASFQRRIMQNLSKTARERYINFLASYPDIEREVKNYHIASYLGITSESLSRIRREMSRKDKP
ncbi:Crp/Fnr family transcriptional regulator [Lishizhenia sp.]|uniref:Crp/Fnr family transcriptional regulator n=1 Tax=Lishizhenia sp. TaxID=2497594 RepID=UPI00299DA43A|nr:Crp/Fnr family transcriptional regulator [Lishizhenia sp.]MDX1445286.1 Crp/Fnr family transcriptional regulator [Lishizhenia sp.]